MVDGQQTDKRLTMAILKLTNEPKGSGELITLVDNDQIHVKRCFPSCLFSSHVTIY